MLFEEPQLKDILTEDMLLDMAGSRSYERGVGYWQQALVRGLVQDGNTIVATVRGTYDYEVRLWVEDGELDYSCSCPVGERGDFCKHCVAVGLEWLNAGEEKPATKEPGKRSKATMDDVRAYLQNRDKSELVELIIKSAMSDEDLRDSLMLKAALVSPEGLDAKAFKKSIDKALTLEAIYDEREYYYHDDEVEFDEKALARISDAMSALVDSGHAEDAIDFVEYTLHKLEDTLMEEDMDYSSEVADDFIQKLQGIHHSACLQAKPDPCELARKLFNRALSTDGEYFGDAAEEYADVLGEEGMACYRKLAKAEWDRKLNDGSIRKYDYITRVMQNLAIADNDLETLISIKSMDLSNANAYLDIAETYKKAGDSDQAVEWAKRGLNAFTDNSDLNLRKFLIDEYRKRKHWNDAIDLAWSMFSRYPNIDYYRLLKELADNIGQWQQLREKALAKIRERIEQSKEGRSNIWGYNDSSVIVEIFIWEGDLESALSEARKGNCRFEIWLQLAGKLEQKLPDESIKIYRTSIEHLVDETNNAAYEWAVVLLHKVNKLMQRNEFNDYTAHLRKTFFRKRNFIALLNSAHWE